MQCPRAMESDHTMHHAGEQERRPLSTAPRSHDAATKPLTPPHDQRFFDAIAVLRGDLEPMGSHETLEAALAALSPCGEGGAVIVGLTLRRVHPGTDARGRAILHSALALHGVRELETLLTPQEGPQP